MKLFIAFLLVTLALCCNEANAVTCPDLVLEETAFMQSPEISYRLFLKKYDAPPEIVVSKMKVKDCVNKLSLENRQLFGVVVEEILLKCGQELKKIPS